MKVFKLFGIHLYKRRSSKRSAQVRVRRLFELIIKSIIMLSMPILPTVIVSFLWYFVLFKHGLYFNEGMENIVVAAWIPTFGLLYCLLVAVIFNTVWTEYKAIRTAVKRYDIETFVDLMDEAISPLIYTLVIICSLSISGGFMSLKYQDITYGAIIISSTSYLLFLVLFIIKEMDDPCTGIWFIKSIHEEWLEIDARKWRVERCEKLKGKEVEKKNRSHKRV